MHITTHLNVQHLKNSSTIVVMIQESKDTLNSAFIKSLWSSKDIGWDYVASVGSSGEFLPCGTAVKYL